MAQSPEISMHQAVSICSSSSTYNIVELLGEPTISTPGPMSNDRINEAGGCDRIHNVRQHCGSFGHSTTDVMQLMVLDVCHMVLDVVRLLLLLLLLPMSK
jgi:hypothetical protein